MSHGIRAREGKKVVKTKQNSVKRKTLKQSSVFEMQRKLADSEFGLTGQKLFLYLAANVDHLEQK